MIDNVKSSMPKEAKEKWLAALRSGEYEQGQARLEDSGKYCCLGVLQHCLTGEVETLNSSSKVAMLMPSASWLAAHDIHFLDLHGDLCDEPLFAMAVSQQDKIIYEGASSVNDGGKYSFAEIADLIETNVEGL